MFVGSHHSISITGKIIKDLELYYNGEGIAIIKLSIPVNNVFRNENEEEIVETTWFEVTINKKTAEATYQHLRRGDHIQVIGRLRPEVKVREMRNGKIVGSYEVIADKVIFLPDRSNEQKS